MQELRELLLLTLKGRQAVNPRYSLRALARDMKISPTALSQFFAGKRQLSPRNARNVGESLYLPAERINGMLSSGGSSDETGRIDLESFALIADWYHYGILNLALVDKLKAPEQVAERLGISLKLAREAVERLVHLGLLKKERGILKRQAPPLDTGSDVPSQALRKHNREKMELAIRSLEEVPVSERDVSSLTLAFDPHHLEKVKGEIARFKERVRKIGESKSVREVYSLNIQFFPLSKPIKRSEP